MAIGTPAALGSAYNGVSANTLVITTTTDAPVGSTIIIAAAYRLTSGTITSVTDNAATPNTYIAGATTLGFTYPDLRIFYAPVLTDLPSGSSITITYSSVSTNIKFGTAFVVSGLSSTPFDSSATATGTSTAPSATTATLNSAAATAGEIVFALMGVNGTQTVSAEGSWTDVGTDIASSARIHVAYQIVSATTALTYSPTLSASAGWSVMLQGFIGASTGTTASPTQAAGTGVAEGVSTRSDDAHSPQPAAGIGLAEAGQVSVSEAYPAPRGVGVGVAGSLSAGSTVNGSGTPSPATGAGVANATSEASAEAVQPPPAPALGVARSPTTTTGTRPRRAVTAAQIARAA